MKYNLKIKMKFNSEYIKSQFNYNNIKYCYLVLLQNYYYILLLNLQW